MESPDTDGNETSRPVLAPMDDRKWIAIMVASMLVLVGVQQSWCSGRAL